jgi:hypothetical protein
MDPQKRAFPNWEYTDLQMRQAMMLTVPADFFLTSSILFILVRHTSQYYRIILITPSSVTLKYICICVCFYMFRSVNNHLHKAIDFSRKLLLHRT